MRCEDGRSLLSAAADGELAESARVAVADHLRACAACQDYSAQLSALRRAVRFELLGEAPDVAPAVLRHLGNAGAGRRGAPAGTTRAVRTARRQTGRATAVAVFVTAFAVGAMIAGVHPRRPTGVAAAEVPAQVLAAQTRLRTLNAEVAVVEHGWHPDVPVREYRGRLTYAAPESLALTLDDQTAYPDERWRPNDVAMVADEAWWWTSGPAPCPREAQPRCQSSSPRVRALTGREPFDDATPAALDLVLPTRSFALAAAPEPLGTTRVAGRPAVGVAVPVAQAAPLLEGLRPAGDWRGLHPADRVELWLDAAALVPLRLRVLPALTDDRELWAARRGYDDPAGRVLFEVVLTAVAVNAGVPEDAFPSPPAAAAVRDAGFEESTGSALDSAGQTLVPAWLPAGMEPSRAGRLSTAKGPAVEVATWTDGRAWLKVRTTRGWVGGRLFGDLGEAVTQVDLGAAGVGYADERGSRVAVHSQGVDAVVSGSLAPADLRRVAASLGVRGSPVPAGWAEASSATLADAAATLPGLLVAPALPGFGAPAVRVERDVVTISQAGAGAVAFVLVQREGERLAPPLGLDVTGVAVRGTEARYAARTGELEWVEAGVVRSLRSATLGLSELLAIAEALRPP